MLSKYLTGATLSLLVACSGAHDSNAALVAAGGLPGAAGDGSAGSSGSNALAGSAGVSAGAGAADSAGASSGAAGAAGAEPHIVAACPSSTGTELVGKWQNVTPQAVSLDPKFNGFNTGVNSFAISPTNTAIVYLGTCSQGIYKSTDCGATWTHLSSGRNGAALDGGRNWIIQVDPVETNVIYANSGYGMPGLWKSVNSGVDWDQLFPESSEFAKVVELNFVEFLAIDPTNHRHLVVSSHGKCAGTINTPICLAESNDAGATWRLLKGDAEMFYEAAGHALIDSKTWLYFMPFVGVFTTTDGGASWKKAYAGGASNQTGEVYRSKDGSYFLPSYNGVLKSADGLSWTLIPNSPRSTSLAGDGTNMFTSASDEKPATAYSTSNGDGSNWAAYASPQMAKGSWLMRYDVDHHLLYSSNETGGFWRVQTQ